MSEIFIIWIVDADDGAGGRFDVDFASVIGRGFIAFDRRRFGRRVERIESHGGHRTRDAPTDGRGPEIMNTLTRPYLINVSRRPRRRSYHTRQMVTDAVDVFFNSQTIIAGTQQRVAAHFIQPRRRWRRWRHSADVVDQMVTAERPYQRFTASSRIISAAVVGVGSAVGVVRGDRWR